MRPTTASAITAAGGRTVASIVDASTSEGGRASVQTAVEHFGRLDVVVANAGIIHSTLTTSLDWPAARFEDQFRHHLFATFHVVKPAFATMKRRLRQVVSCHRRLESLVSPGLTGYAAAKTPRWG